MPVMTTAGSSGDTDGRLLALASARWGRSDFAAVVSGGTGQPLPHRASEKEALSLHEPLVQHRLDRRLHDPHLLLDDRVVVVGVAPEVEGLAEMEPISGR